VRPELKSLYTTTIVQQALDTFGVTESRLLSDWHAATYGGARSDGGCVLRLSHAAHRTGAQIEAELAWMRELIALSVAAPAPLRSVSGRYAEAIGDDRAFTAVAFGLLRGREIGPDDWGPALFERWGELVGRLHQLTTSHRPAHARPHWHESDFLNIERYIPDAETTVKASARALLARLRAQPTDSPHYGLIHADIYQENLRLLPDGELELYDFDNCEYGWLVSDLANALYASLWRVRDYARRPTFAAGFLEAFLRGYEREHHLPAAELARLGDFLLLRDVLIYTVGCKLLDRAHLTPLQARLQSEHRARIAEGIPIVPVPC
jgi:Ser/Thr protein kinase RdoA (MazF antagonist)